MNNLENAKKIAAEKALDFVENGMVLGLGTGSTVKYFLEALGREIKGGNLKEVIGIPSSKNTERISRELGIPLATLDEYHEIDLDVDGADEVDEKFNLIKGGGGAHTREKIVATASKKFVVIVDERKLVGKFTFPVPVEVLKFSKKLVEDQLREMGGVPKLRENFLTDEGNIILDTKFLVIQAEKLEVRINEISGVLENGIFSRRKPEKVVVGYRDGKVKVMERK